MVEAAVSNAAAWWLVVVTGVLALVTCGLAVATFLAVTAGNRTAQAAEQDIEQGQALIQATQAQATASWEQAQTALAVLEADWLPYVVPASESHVESTERDREFRTAEFISTRHQPPKVGRCWFENEGSSQEQAWMVFAIRNVGRGPALILRSPGDVVLKYPGSQQGSYGESTSIVIAPGQVEYICVVEGRDAMEQPRSLAKMLMEVRDNGGNPTVRATYRPELTVRFSDTTGRNEWRTRITYRFSGMNLKPTSVAVETHVRRAVNGH